MSTISFLQLACFLTGGTSWNITEVAWEWRVFHHQYLCWGNALFWLPLIIEVKTWRLASLFVNQLNVFYITQWEFQKEDLRLFTLFGIWTLWIYLHLGLDIHFVNREPSLFWAVGIYYELHIACFYLYLFCDSTRLLLWPNNPTQITIFPMCSYK